MALAFKVLDCFQGFPVVKLWLFLSCFLFARKRGVSPAAVEKIDHGCLRTRHHLRALSLWRV